jgi:hypothetical protein
LASCLTLQLLQPLQLPRDKCDTKLNLNLTKRPVQQIGNLTEVLLTLTHLVMLLPAGAEDGTIKVWKVRS